MRRGRTLGRVCGAVIASAYLTLLASTAIGAEAIGPVAHAAVSGPAVTYLGHDDDLVERLALGAGPRLLHLDLQANEFDVTTRLLVIHDQLPSPVVLDSLREWVIGGGWILVIPGRVLGESLPGTLAARLGLPQAFENRTGPVTVSPRAAPSAFELAGIPWHSAPQIGARTVPTAPSRLETLLGSESGEAIVSRSRLGAGQFLVFAPWLDLGKSRSARLENKGANYSLRTWSYFNYLLHRIECEAANTPPQSFRDWPRSPVPHRGATRAIAGAFAILLTLNALAFGVVRRYSGRHPELLSRFFGSRRAFPSDDAAGVEPPETSRIGERWEVVGFRRPLAGFLYLLSVSLLVLVPGYLAVLSFNYDQISPFPESVGAWQIIQGLMGVFWIFLDLGTGYAFVKYFAQYRVTDPARGVMYAQFFVWWQALSGVAQVGAVALVAAGVLPRTAYAYLSYAILLHSVIQYPGFLKIFAQLFNALQRFDLHQTMGVLTMVLAVPSNFTAVLLMRAWGARHPEFGEAMGATFGLVLGGYLNELLLFVVGYGFTRRLGLGLRVLFLAHFDRAVVISALRYGVAAAAAGLFGQNYLLATRLPNYPQLSGILQVSLSALVGYLFTQRFIDTLVPTISEAFANGKEALTRYTIGEAVRWSMIATVCYGAPFLAISDLFILGVLGPQWERAAEYTRVLHVWGMTQFLGLIPDSIALGTGRTRIYASTVAAEQVLKIAVSWWLVPIVGLWGVILGSLVATLVGKIAISWWLVQRSVIRVRLPWWQALGAPAVAALVVGIGVRAFSLAWWSPTPARSFGLVMVAIGVGAPAVLWLTAWFGGWDRRTLGELQEAVELSGSSRWLVKILFRFPVWGARFSPLHGRAPVLLFDAANREAEELTRDRAVALDSMHASSPDPRF